MAWIYFGLNLDMMEYQKAIHNLQSDTCETHHAFAWTNQVAGGKLRHPEPNKRVHTSTIILFSIHLNWMEFGWCALCAKIYSCILVFVCVRVYGYFCCGWFAVWIHRHYSNHVFVWKAKICSFSILFHLFAQCFVRESKMIYICMKERECWWMRVTTRSSTLAARPRKENFTMYALSLANGYNECI